MGSIRRGIILMAYASRDYNGDKDGRADGLLGFHALLEDAIANAVGANCGDVAIACRDPETAEWMRLHHPDIALIRPDPESLKAKSKSQSWPAQVADKAWRLRYQPILMVQPDARCNLKERYAGAFKALRPGPDGADVLLLTDSESRVCLLGLKSPQTGILSTTDSLDSTTMDSINAGGVTARAKELGFRVEVLQCCE